MVCLSLNRSFFHAMSMNIHSPEENALQDGGTENIANCMVLVAFFGAGSSSGSFSNFFFEVSRVLEAYDGFG